MTVPRYELDNPAALTLASRVRQKVQCTDADGRVSSDVSVTQEVV